MILYESQREYKQTTKAQDPFLLELRNFLSVITGSNTFPDYSFINSCRQAMILENIAKKAGIYNKAEKEDPELEEFRSSL